MELMVSSFPHVAGVVPSLEGLASYDYGNSSPLSLIMAAVLSPQSPPSNAFCQNGVANTSRLGPMGGNDCTGRPHFIVPHFIDPCRCYFLFKLQVYTVLHCTNLSLPFFQQHLLTSYLCVTFWQFQQYFKLFRYYYICYGDLWSVIFVTTVKTLQLAEGSDNG